MIHGGDNLKKANKFADVFSKQRCEFLKNKNINYENKNAYPFLSFFKNKNVELTDKIKDEIYNDCVNVSKKNYIEGYLSGDKHGFNRGKNENSLCLSSIPGEFLAFPERIVSLISTKQDLKDPGKKYVIKLPSEEIECNKKFEIIDKDTFGSLIYFYKLPNNYLLDYFEKYNIKITNDTLDFSNTDFNGIKLSDSLISVDILKNIIINISKFQKCDVLKNIKKIFLYKQDFLEKHLQLISYIFDNFPNVYEIHFGIKDLIKDTIEKNLKNQNFTFEIINDIQNGDYILAKRINTDMKLSSQSLQKSQGGKQKKIQTRKHKRKNKKTHKKLNKIKK